MKIELMASTPRSERTVALAARLCYSPVGIEQLDEKMSDGEAARLVRMLRDMGHLSPLEHASFTVAVEGVSRALTHQLVRSRIASYSQQSQRYVEEGQFEMVVPPSVRSSPEATEAYLATMDGARRAYLNLIELGVPAEDARFVLGQGFATKIVISKNARAWLEWFRLRCCTRAQWEIRVLAHRILNLLREEAPVLFEDAGPPCVAEGLCREGKMSCGRIDRLPPRPPALHLRREGEDSPDE